jgi:hypothetical protein
MKHLTGLCFFLTAALSLFSQTPDRVPLADEWGYRPADGSTVSVNPPSLSWVHEQDAAGYVVEWADNDAFRRASSAHDLRWSVYTHHEALTPGTYYWRYRIVSKDGGQSAWSRTRRFIVPADAAVFPQPTMDEMRQRIPKGHPRLFVRPEGVERLKAWAGGGGREAFQKIIARANELLTAEPTPEPTVRASAYDPKTQQF